jgi:pyruvate-formate lyase
MTEKIEQIKNLILSKEHHVFRQDTVLDWSKEFSEANMSLMQRASIQLVRLLQAEKPVILPNERIVFTRTIKHLPEICTESEWNQIKNKYYIHELGKVCNIGSDFETTIKCGLDTRRQDALLALQNCTSEEGKELLNGILIIIDAIFDLSERYAKEAERIGNSEIAKVLRKVPHNGATTFLEALQFFRILHFTLWLERNYHNTIGRFDQYMYPYLKSDLEEGRLTQEKAFELLEEFFLTFNRDSDLYPGMQQGDNGQSLVIGGVDENDLYAYNLLSEMVLKASLDLNVIDPKINIRVNKHTGKDIYLLGTELTKRGLGFPQYSNDDIVIPGLLDMGYSLKDARNYTVAACWEFIIPKYGMDIPNIAALSFVDTVNNAIHNSLMNVTDFNALMQEVKNQITKEVNKIADKVKNIFIEPAPFQSLLMDSCIENGRDISKGGKYNNYGIHGTGISTATDALSAVKKYVFEEKSVLPADMINALNNNFSGYESLQAMLRYDAPKMGNDDYYADSIAIELFEGFSNSLQDLSNERGGCFRPGAGSAMYYIWHAMETGASADGRKSGEPFAANFSPSLFARLKGPVSIMHSFSKPNLRKIINGGPLTLELHDSAFRNNEGKEKVAMLVKSYFDMGGQQLQLNAINREALMDAQKSPDKYRNLIVRVWGWSGYFVELDKVYQDHIIQRMELRI